MERAYPPLGVLDSANALSSGGPIPRGASFSARRGSSMCACRRQGGGLVQASAHLRGRRLPCKRVTRRAARSPHISVCVAGGVGQNLFLNLGRLQLAQRLQLLGGGADLGERDRWELGILERQPAHQSRNGVHEA
eukprot:scaffold7018_cov120-Isochrysis_galbana.AAC.3